MLEGIECPPDARGNARAALAVALAGAGGDAERIVSLARAAKADFAQVAGETPEQLAELEALLRRRG
jgi:hypothetical protein